MCITRRRQRKTKKKERKQKKNDIYAYSFLSFPIIVNLVWVGNGML